MNSLAEKLDKHFNITGKYPDKGIDFIVGIRAIMCGEYKGNFVSATIQNDAKELEKALLRCDIEAVLSINKKYFKTWNKNQTNNPKRYVKPNLAAGELFTKTLKVLSIINDLEN